MRAMGSGRVRMLVNGYRSTAVLVAATQIGLFRALATGPKPVDALAAETKVQLQPLERLVRALVAMELLALAPEGVALTSEGTELVSDEAGIEAQLQLVA